MGNFFSNTLSGPTYGPKNLWLKLFGNHKFIMFNHISSPSSKFTSHQDLSTKSLYHLCAFSRFALAISHKRHLFSSSCVTISTSSFTSLGGCPCATQVVGTISELPVTIWKGVALLSNVPNCCSKIQPTPNGPPNLVDPLPHNSLGIVR